MADVPEMPFMRDSADAVVAREAVRALLARLPPRPRGVVVLKYLSDWPDTDIAKVIGVRVATVRSIARRALTSLRESALTERGSPWPPLSGLAHNTDTAGGFGNG